MIYIFSRKQKIGILIFVISIFFLIGILVVVNKTNALQTSDTIDNILSESSVTLFSDSGKQTLNENLTWEDFEKIEEQIKKIDQSVLTGDDLERYQQVNQVFHMAKTMFEIQVSVDSLLDKQKSVKDGVTLENVSYLQDELLTVSEKTEFISAQNQTLEKVVEQLEIIDQTTKSVNLLLTDQDTPRYGIENSHLSDAKLSVKQLPRESDRVALLERLETAEIYLVAKDQENLRQLQTIPSQPNTSDPASTTTSVTVSDITSTASNSTSPSNSRTPLSRAESYVTSSPARTTNSYENRTISQSRVSNGTGTTATTINQDKMNQTVQSVIQNGEKNGLQHVEKQAKTGTTAIEISSPKTLDRLEEVILQKMEESKRNGATQFSIWYEKLSDGYCVYFGWR